MLNGLSVVRIVIILFPVVSTIRPPDPIPLLQPHYSAFIAPTDRSVPVLCFGTLASRCLPLVLLPWHQSAWFLQFHMRASIRFTPPVRRSPSVQSSGTRQTHPSGASQPLVLTMLDFLTTLHRRVCFRSSPGHLPAYGHALSFCSNAHDHGF